MMEGSWLTARLGRHLSELARLALPVIVSRAGIVFMATVDTAMLGRAGAAEVGHYSLGTSIFIVLMLIGIGLSMGTAVATSHARGAGDLQEAGRAWRRALPFALIVGIVLTGVCQLGEPFFRFTGQSDEIVQGAGRVLAIQSIGMIPTMIYAACFMFLEAMGRPLPVMFAIWAANLINAVLNELFIFGHFGLPAMGADGAALATAIARTGMALALFAYVWWLKDREELGIRNPVPDLWKSGAGQRRYGYAAGMANGFESSAFAVMNIFAGWQGDEQLAIYGVCMNMLALVFMAALGISTATAIRVGIAHGRGDRPDRALAGYVGLGVGVCVMGLATVTFNLIPDTVASIYLVDPRLVAMAAPCVAVVGILLLADGGQIVMSQSLRGAADTWTPTILNFGSYILFMIPLGWFLSTYLGRGVLGLFEGILIASIFSVTVLTSRWTWISFRRGW